MRMCFLSDMHVLSDSAQLVSCCSTSSPGGNLVDGLPPVANGATHSPPGDKFQKSGGPQASMVTTPFHQVPYSQIVSNE